MVRPTVDANTKGWVLYDANCGICTRLAEGWRASFKRKGFELEPLQAEWVAAELGLSSEETVKDFRLLLVDGSKKSGADVYRYMMRFYWWAWPLLFLSKLPPFSTLFNLIYAAFRDNRGKFSTMCGLK